MDTIHSLQLYEGGNWAQIFKTHAHTHLHAWVQVWAGSFYCGCEFIYPKVIIRTKGIEIEVEVELESLAKVLEVVVRV